MRSPASGDFIWSSSRACIERIYFLFQVSFRFSEETLSRSRGVESRYGIVSLVGLVYVSVCEEKSVRTSMRSHTFSGTCVSDEVSEVRFNKDPDKK